MNVIWIHGWGSSPQVWGEAPFFLRLREGCEHRFACFRDLDSIGDCVGEIRRLVDAFGGQPVALVGWSMGGMLAVMAGADDPRVRRIAMVGSTLRFVSGDRRKGWPVRVLDRMIERLAVEPEATLREFHARIGGAPIDNEFSDRLLMEGLRFLRETELTDSGAKLVWIHGTDDPVCPPGAVPDGSETVWIEGAGHMPFRTHPESFASALGSVLG